MVLLFGRLGNCVIIILITPTMSNSKKKEKEIVQTHFEIDMEPVLALDFYIKDILRSIRRTVIFETY
ncbi:hypothetical protein P8452_66386 [Trifolium repens]|nr:hypothetical protein P8452_66386 [Trifolium repens]